MIILAMTRSQKVMILTEAYKANLTTAHDWMWLALNSVSNVPVANVIFKGQSHQFKGTIGMVFHLTKVKHLASSSCQRTCEQRFCERTNVTQTTMC